MNIVHVINEIIRTGKSVFPLNYSDKDISKDIIENILINADRAPTHKFTEPWRFKVIKGAKKKELGEFLAQKYKEITPIENYKEQKFSKLKNNAIKANTIISIGLH